MDQEESSQTPKCIPSEHAFRSTLEKYSMIFKEPEGMTTICLSDVTIPAEKKSSKKFNIHNTAYKRTTLLWILACAITLLMIFVIYEEQGLSVFQSILGLQSDAPYKINHRTMNQQIKETDSETLPCNIVDHEDCEHVTTTQDLGTASYEYQNMESAEATSEDSYNPFSEEQYPAIENTITGSILIKPRFIGLAKPGSEERDESPTDLMEILNIFGILENSSPKRKKRDSSVAKIGSPPQSKENCDVNETTFTENSMLAKTQSGRVEDIQNPRQDRQKPTHQDVTTSADNNNFMSKNFEGMKIKNNKSETSGRNINADVSISSIENKNASETVPVNQVDANMENKYTDATLESTPQMNIAEIVQSTTQLPETRNYFSERSNGHSSPKDAKVSSVAPTKKENKVNSETTVKYSSTYLNTAELPEMENSSVKSSSSTYSDRASSSSIQSVSGQQVKEHSMILTVSTERRGEVNHFSTPSSTTQLPQKEYNFHKRPSSYANAETSSISAQSVSDEDVVEHSTIPTVSTEKQDEISTTKIANQISALTSTTQLPQREYNFQKRPGSYANVETPSTSVQTVSDKHVIEHSTIPILSTEKQEETSTTKTTNHFSALSSTKQLSQKEYYFPEKTSFYANAETPSTSVQSVSDEQVIEHSTIPIISTEKQEEIITTTIANHFRAFSSTTQLPQKEYNFQKRPSSYANVETPSTSPQSVSDEQVIEHSTIPIISTEKQEDISTTKIANHFSAPSSTKQLSQKEYYFPKKTSSYANAERPSTSAQGISDKYIIEHFTIPIVSTEKQEEISTIKIANHFSASSSTTQLPQKEYNFYKRPSSYANAETPSTSAQSVSGEYVKQYPTASVLSTGGHDKITTNANATHFFTSSDTAQWPEKEYKFHGKINSNAYSDKPSTLSAQRVTSEYVKKYSVTPELSTNTVTQHFSIPSVTQLPEKKFNINRKTNSGAYSDAISMESMNGEHVKKHLETPLERGGVSREDLKENATTPDASIKNENGLISTKFVEYATIFPRVSEGPQNKKEARISLESQRKQNMQATFTEEVQSSQTKESQYPCIVPWSYPMMPQYYPPSFPYYPSPQTDQLKIVNVPFPKQKGQIVILNPPVVNYPSYMTSPQGYPQVGSSYGGFPQSSSLQAMDPKGQYYMCNAIPAPSSHITSVQGVEVRKPFNLEDSFSRQRTLYPQEGKNLDCPTDHMSCFDGSKCIKHKHLCDGEADCSDGSDEAKCSCKDRIEAFRHCDGYLDCPEGEDEIGCFGCSENEFSCNDWNPRYRRGTCIPLQQRCDGIEQCPVGYDETDCTILTDVIEEHKRYKISNAVGFLNRNYRGKWYPTCFGTEMWAMEVCKTESGPNPHHLIPGRHLIKTHSRYDGPYIEETESGGLHLINKCAMEDTATLIQCPPLVCGIRLKIHNPYRPQEVETSNEILEEAPPDLLKFDNILGDSRIVGGEGSQPAAWPWVVTVYKNGVFHCSGVIINEWWIVSAAHCVDKYWMYYYEIQAGVLRRFSFAPQTQRRWVTHAIPHPNYNKTTLQHDISLMKLSEPVRYNRYVRPICLPSEDTAGSDYFNAPYPGTKCTVVGWGATAEHSADPDHLREVQVPVLPVCKYEEDRETNAICAGYSDGGKDACQGDSGGPFMCLNPNRPHQWFLAGVVSHGEGCARPNEPGIYTRVSLYIEWIYDHINSQQSLPPQRPLQRCPGHVCRETNRCISKKRHCDKIVDCLHGDDELDCNTWKMDDYFKHMEYVIARHTNTSFEAAEDDDTADDLIVGGSINSQPQTVFSSKKRFTCKKLIQHFPISKRCNKIADCEDATDEVNCTCKDYLLATHPDAICDGVTDCADLSDEKDCGNCKQSQYHCRLSRKCIPLKSRCDGKVDCLFREDEWDCLALSNGTNIELDADLRPELKSSGIVASNYRGTWRVTCTNQQESDTQARIAAYICNYLGFNDYYKYKTFPGHRLRNKMLTLSNNASTFVEVESKDNCSLFYVKCSREITHARIQHFVGDEERLEEQFYSPWNAAIYVDGSHRCVGVLIDLSWVLTSSHCFQHKLHDDNYVTVLLGFGRAHLQVQGPYEQIIPVGSRIYVPDSTAVLLRLYYPVTHTRQVRPIALKTRADTNRETCVASGLDKNGSIRTVKLTVISNKCKAGFKCLRRKIPARNETCESLSWTGVVVCESGSGWHPSALFLENKGHCGFNEISKYPAINPLKNKISAFFKNTSVTTLPKCDGFRCKLGQCIDNRKTCDGIPDCRSAEDESQQYCTKQNRTCHLSNNCGTVTALYSCSKWELKCSNGKCVPKSKFCNRINDCGDGSDEPSRCTCKKFLKLTEPTKLCDGIIHCRDSGDEQFCPCNGNNFKCENSSTCVANATVCDGIYDCPKGEDETNCISFKTFEGETTAGQVITRTAGVWHSGCFPRSMEQHKLSLICGLLNMKGEYAKQLRTDKPELGGRAVFDRFSAIPISRIGKNVVLLRMRSGHNPYITFKNSTDNNCYKLFVDCQ